MSSKRVKKRTSLNIKIRANIFWFFGILVIIVGFIVLINRNQQISCANSISCIKDLSGEFRVTEKKGEFMGKIVNVPDQLIKNSKVSTVLGENSSLNKHIYVDLTNQKLYAKEGDTTIYEFLISSGKWGKTPTGDFTIWIKINSTRMKGGSRELGTFYDLPNVPWTMFFYNNSIPKTRGYGIHGAYWHDNFGHPMSHGCINMKIEEAKLLYEWANPVSSGHSTLATSENPGTPITIYGKSANY